MCVFLLCVVMVTHHYSHHLIARGLTFTGDFRSALHHEKITYNIHKEKVKLIVLNYAVPSEANLTQHEKQGSCSLKI